MVKKEAITTGYRKILGGLRERGMSVTAILAFVLSLLVLVQNLSGVLWNYERPLVVETVIKQEEGAFRLLLNTFDVNVPERLTERVQVLEDGRSLTRYSTKYELLASPDGFFVFGNKLWVKPRSGEPKDLVGRFPVEVKGHATALIWGATLFVLLGVVVWTPERERWRGFIGRSVAAAERLRSRLVAITMSAARQSSARPFRNDLLALLLLALIATVIFFPRVNDFGHSVDGFHMSHLMEIGELPIYTVNEPKEPGRPFLGLGWNLAAALGGGSVVGYYVFMFSCLTLSAMVVYAIVRVLVPDQPVWALLGSALKLVWAANFEVYENHSVAIYFAEFQFWLATFLFVRLAVNRTPPRRIEVLLAPIVIATCLLTAVGTYQTPWPVILITPLFLVASGLMEWKTRRAGWLLSLWYLATLPMMLWCAWLSYRLAQEVSPSVLEIYVHLVHGFRAVTWDAVLYPFIPDRNPGLEVNPNVALIILMFALLFGWFGLQSLPALRRQSRERSTQVTAILVFTSLAIIGGSLLLPSILYRPELGTRFMHWPSVGTIVLIVTLLAWLSGARAQGGGVVSAALAVVLFSSMILRMDAVRNLRVEGSLTNRRFWEGIVSSLPQVKEGTVILMDGPAAGAGTTDFFATWIFRALTKTRATYFITDSTPEYQADKERFEVSSVINFNREVEPFDPGVNQFRDTKMAVLSESEVFPVSADRVVWLSWNPYDRLLMVDPERSAMDRINKNVRSEFGDLLFPVVTAGKSPTP